jgi:hypothetical protein
MRAFCNAESPSPGIPASATNGRWFSVPDGSVYIGDAPNLVRTSIMSWLRSTCTAVAIGLAASAGTQAQQIAPDGIHRLPFTATLSNNTPLAFGMDVGETSRALGQPLQRVSGRPGNEIYLAFRNLGGSGLIPHHNRLFLKFRKGRLTGWKEDYGENWMWQ